MLRVELKLGRESSWKSFTIPEELTAAELNIEGGLVRIENEPDEGYYTVKVYQDAIKKKYPKIIDITPRNRSVTFPIGKADVSVDYIK